MSEQKYIICTDRKNLFRMPKGYFWRMTQGTTNPDSDKEIYYLTLFREINKQGKIISSISEGSTEIRITKGASLDDFLVILGQSIEKIMKKRL